MRLSAPKKPRSSPLSKWHYKESGLYYLQTRYYDPAICRFINADTFATTDITSLLSANMFAYCENNPINRADPSGHFWGVVHAVVAVVALVVTGYHNISRRNYKRNSKTDSNPSTTTKNKVIKDQNLATGENFEFGLYKANWNACETIAVHNAKVLNGIDSCLSDTMKDFQDVYAMIGYGAFGSNPFAIGRVLDKEGIEYSRISLDDMTQEGTYIISYWTKTPFLSSIHTVAVSYDGIQYTTYNKAGYDKLYYLPPSEYAGHFICGYYLN